MITSAYSNRSNSLVLIPVLQKFQEMIFQVIISKVVCGFFLILLHWRFINNFIVKNYRDSSVIIQFKYKLTQCFQNLFKKKMMYLVLIYRSNRISYRNNPANISTSGQRYFNFIDQGWNNADPTLEMKQNPTSNFQRCTALIQRRCLMLKQRWNNVERTLSRRGFNGASTLVKAVSKTMRLVK